MKTLTLPVFGPNTSSPSALLVQYTNAADAVEDACTAIANIQFVQADYENGFLGRWQHALHERTVMLTHLRDIKGQLTTIANHCRDCARPTA